MQQKKEKHNHPVSVFRRVNSFDIYTVYVYVLNS